MGNIFLVRHGQDEDNAKGVLNGLRDSALTRLGKTQAHEVAHKLRDNNIQIIYSSPLQRALETARIIAEHLKLRVETMNLLVERDFGILTGKPLTDIPKLASKTMQGEKVLYFLDGDGVEDFPTCLSRATKVLAFVKQKHPNENVLLVTHGDIGKMVRAAFHGWNWEKGLQTPYFSNTGVLELLQGVDSLE